MFGLHVQCLVVILTICRVSARHVVDTDVDVQTYYNRKGRPNMRTPIPAPDGNLNMYVLPAGQGDAHVIQCPNGDLSIIDLGRGTETYEPKYWQPEDIRTFLGGQYNRIRSLLVTHNHWDHYILYLDVFQGTNELPNVENVYISCLFDAMPQRLQDWITQQGLQGRLSPFNNGNECGPNGVECGNLDLCPGDSRIVAKVLAANMGGNCYTGNKNMDSILFKLSWGQVSVMMTGDFEDATTNWDEVGPQRRVVEYYGAEMEVTVYKIAHHGASRLANKPVFRDAVRPKAIFATGNPYYPGGYRHPRCAVSDAFILYVRTLCRPAVTDSSDPEYCGDPIDPSWTIDQRRQSVYTCGESDPDWRTITDNEYAIYTTTPDGDTINYLTFKTDGTRWGFKNEISSGSG